MQVIILLPNKGNLEKQYRFKIKFKKINEEETIDLPIKLSLIKISCT